MATDNLHTIRSFRTRQFRVVVEALPEYDLDLSWDEDGTVKADLDAGRSVAFCAHAYVQHDTLGVLAEDYLGECIYADFDEFQDHRECAKAQREWRAKGETSVVCGSYFADMVRSVCAEARRHIVGLQLPRVRRVGA